MLLGNLLHLIHNNSYLRTNAAALVSGRQITSREMKRKTGRVFVEQKSKTGY